MLQFKVAEQLCVRCGECEAVCPAGIVTMPDLPEITSEERCYRCQHCYAVCPSGALSILGLDPAEDREPARDFPAPAQMASLVKWRRTVRRYKNENLPSGLIDELVETACHAPTGVNSRDVLFTVVRDKAYMAGLSREVHDRLGKLADEGKLPDGLAGQYLGWAVNAWRSAGNDVIFRGAPHMLVASAPKNAPTPVQDTHIALATFELLAVSHGLGTLWDGLAMMAFSVCPDLTRRLGIPEDHMIGYAMLFGAPGVHFARTARRAPANVNYPG